MHGLDKVVRLGFYALGVVTVACSQLKPNQLGDPENGGAGAAGDTAIDAVSGAGAAGETDATSAGGNAGSNLISGGGQTSSGTGGMAGEVSTGGQDAAESSGGGSPCASACDTEGVFRCTDETHLSICTAHDECLFWTDPAPCPGESLCCEGRCLPIDESNCYACGARCTETTPVCDPRLRACACDTEECANRGGTCSGPNGECVGAFDVYVDVSAVESGDGSFESPLQTITGALERARSRISARIHVAPGTYSAESGETFPLVVPPSVSLEGSGEERTIISGIGFYDAEPSGGDPRTVSWATIVIGDPIADSGVSRLALNPGFETPSPSHFGVVCNRGNSLLAGTSKTSPNTWLSQLRIGPGYARAVSATTSTSPEPSGCSLILTSSVILNSDSGVVGVGCDSGVSSAELPVAIELGDGTPQGGNLFTGIDRPDNNGIAVMLRGCVTRLSASFNTFTDSNVGINAEQPAHAEFRSRHVIRNNRFDRLTNNGVGLWGAGIEIEDFSNNSFTRISAAPQPYCGIGLILQGGPMQLGDTIVEEAGFARILRARNNEFIGNEIGVIYRWYLAPEQYDPPDFGTPEEPGQNTFACNRCTTYPGGDVSIGIGSRSELTLPFAGNYWDHVPPSVVAGQHSGADVALGDPAWPLAVDVSGAGIAPVTCDD